MLTPEQERLRTLRARLEDEKGIEWPAEEWQGYGLLAQAVFFVLTIAGIAAFFHLTEQELLTAALCIALAEFLIRARRWWGTGVEAALWLGGVFAALQALPDSNAPEANLLIAAAAGVAGFRVRNPPFGALAASFVVRYCEVKWDLGTLSAVAIATAALFALYRTWIRPSNEWLFIVLMLTMPLAGWDHAGAEWRLVTIALYAAFAAAALRSAIRKRHHAMFLAAAIGAFVAVAELHELYDPPEELTLALAGAALLLLSWLTARALRGRTRGLVITPARLTAFDGDLESLGAFTAAVPSAGNPPEQRPQGGGGFGGAGATGDY